MDGGASATPAAGPLAVVKVGGGLLGTAADLRRAAAAVAARRRRGERVLVVVSALRGVTDRLERAGREALDPRAGAEMLRASMDALRARHERLAGELPGGAALTLRLLPVLDQVERLLTGIMLTGELTPRVRDLLMTRGERLAAPLLAAAVVAQGADARALGAEEAGLVATGPFGLGACDLGASAPGLAALRHELFDRVLVLTGYYGVSAAGEVVTFGRGGTDYTAGAVAAGLDADHLELWKDVPGFLTADPGFVAEGRLVPELSFDEACELGFYGARILHPRSLDPLRGRGTHVSVRPIDPRGEPDAGTRLVERRRVARPAVVSLAARPRVALVRVAGAAMVDTPGVAGLILARVGALGVDVGALAASMTSVSFTIDEDDAPAVLAELRLLEAAGEACIDELLVLRGRALVGVVGDGVAGEGRLAARALSCLAGAGVPVDLISHGPRDVGLSVAVPEPALGTALGALHGAFFEERVAAREGAREGASP